MSARPHAAARPGRGARWRFALVLPALLALGGCAAMGYYWQSAAGHLRLMQAAQPVPEWLDAASTPAPLRARLQLAQHMRAFAVTELGLPDNASYQRYADLKRPAVVWNVVAAPAYALTPKRWCFLLLGCVSYRGYFHEADARAEAAALAAQGLEVAVYGVPAYSTLGWLNWAGGDPLLSTFIHDAEGDLARLLFHELAHQVVYVRDDSSFNESFATVVERQGSAQWLAQQASPAVRAEDATREARRQAFRALVRQTRRELEAVYAQDASVGLDAPKQAVMQQFRLRYVALRAGWPEAAARHYDAWVAGANNASFAAQATYDEWVPAFEALLVREGGPTPAGWRRFHAAVRALAQQPRDIRDRTLSALGGR